MQNITTDSENMAVINYEGQQVNIELIANINLIQQTINTLSYFKHHLKAKLGVNLTQ